MRLFLDTNLFVAVVTDEPETEDLAAELLSTDHELLTSTRNLMNRATAPTKRRSSVPTRSVGCWSITRT
jgi:uncharacterized protein with PIN domain